MTYPVLGSVEGEEVLSALRNANPVPRHEVRWVAAGDEFDTELVEDLIERLYDLRDEQGEPREGGKRFWAAFEGKASEVVHNVLGLEPIAAADPEFWTWMVFGRDDDRLVRLVDWRHSAPGLGKANPVNYGLTTQLAEGFYSRLWLRGDIGYEPGTAEPYALAWRGDQDIWRSHILRQEYAYPRQVARALIRFQYPDVNPSKATVSVDTIRKMAKELKRINATLAFELLSDGEAMDLLIEVRDSL